MAAHYDTYDYPTYWEGREYEHNSECIAIKSFLERIPQIKTILEIGCGFGRLTPTYLYRSKKTILSDPSLKLLKMAREKFQENKKVVFYHSNLSNLTTKIRSGSIDLAIMVRVIHHIEDLNETFNTVAKMLRKNGYFILEFANKRHFKATIKEFVKGNLTYPLDISPKDARSKKSLRQNTIPFINHHPDVVIHALQNAGFEILDKRSVSNIRSPRLKNLLPLPTLLGLEKTLQKPLSYVYFGPSIFLLVRKRG